MDVPGSRRVNGACAEGPAVVADRKRPPAPEVAEVFAVDILKNQSDLVAADTAYGRGLDEGGGRRAKTAQTGIQAA